MDSEESEWFTGLSSIRGKEKTANCFRCLMKQEPMLRGGHRLQAQPRAAGEFPAAANLSGDRVVEFKAKRKS